MGNRSRLYFKQKDLQPKTLEELAKEKERIRKQQHTRQDVDMGGQYRADQGGSQALLDALIREHPEKDPANLK